MQVDSAAAPAPYFPPDAFAQLAEAEQHHWWFRSRNRVLLWTLATKTGGFKNFLEVGCGTGFVLEGIRKAYPDIELFGAEYFEEGLTIARKRVPSAVFSQTDATLMRETECYDVIGAFDVIEHIEEDEKALNNFARALRHGGALVITVPQHRWLWSLTDEQACHVRRYRRSELMQKVRHAGLRVSYAASFVSLLLPLMWVMRMRPKPHKEQRDPMSEFRIPAWLNSCLEAVMNAELLLLQLGIRFPAGGSLVLVAHKA